MSFEESITWEFLKNLADALDSYRIRALIDAKQDILEAGIYNEDQYENILITMLDEEKLKYSLLNFLKTIPENGMEVLTHFSEKFSVSALYAWF